SLAIGSLRLKGAALSSWMEFTKAHRADLYAKAIRITGFTEGKKGRITFRMPVLTVADVSPETQAAATALDVTLQEFLSAYLKRTVRDRVETAVAHYDEQDQRQYQEEAPSSMPPLTDDDIPF